MKFHPTVAACFCDGVSEIKDAQELRVKETDRLKVMARQANWCRNHRKRGRINH